MSSLHLLLNKNLTMDNILHIEKIKSDSKKEIFEEAYLSFNECLKNKNYKGAQEIINVTIQVMGMF